MLALVALAICYVSGPFLAGAFSVGDRLGPAFYPRTFHQSIYIVAHETFRNEKPRLPFDSWMYWRPLFYGMLRRLKSPEDRAAYIEMARRNKSPALSKLIEMDQDANHSPEGTLGKSPSSNPSPVSDAPHP
jgi:hypothetical protein